MPYDKQSAKLSAVKSHSTLARSKYPPARAQALDVQIALHDASKLLREDLKECTDSNERARIASSLANVAKGWQSMNDQIRIMRGIGAPKSVPAVNEQRKQTRTKPAPIESAPSSPEPPKVSPTPADSKADETNI